MRGIIRVIVPTFLRLSVQSDSKIFIKSVVNTGQAITICFVLDMRWIDDKQWTEGNQEFSGIPCHPSESEQVFGAKVIMKDMIRQCLHRLHPTQGYEYR